MFERLFMTLQALRGNLTAQLKEDEGATMVEYGLLVVGIAIVVGAAAAVFGGELAEIFENLL